MAKQYGLKFRNILLWKTHNAITNAAILGYLPFSRYFLMTDALLEWQTRELLAREQGRDRHTVHVRPELVVEIAFNDLQESPHYPGGLALRFARVKGYRPDKRAEDADTIDTVRAIHAAQGGG